MIKISNASSAAFTWSATEQVWPFEKDASGNTLYCQEVDLGTMPNATVKTVAANSYVNSKKVFKFWGVGRTANDNGDCITLPYVSNAYTSHWVLFTFPGGSFRIHTGVDYSAYSAKGYVIYAK